MEAVIGGAWGGQGGHYWRLVVGDGNVRRIMRILLSSGSIIDGITFEFEHGETGGVMYREFGGRGGNNVVIDLDSSQGQEYFTNIRGHVGVLNVIDTTGTTVRTCEPLVCSLTFETNLRTYGPFGTEQGTAFSTSLQNARIVGFHGRCGRYLDSIGVYAVAE